MSKSKKVLISVLIVLTVSLAGASGYIAYRLNKQDTSVEESSASGFGETATSDLYKDVFMAFKASPCESFVSKDTIISAFPVIASAEDELQINEYNYELDVYPKYCEYKIGNLELFFSIYTYNKDSVIAGSQVDLISKVNLFSLPEIISEYGELDDYKIFLGNDYGAEKRCRFNIFNSQNDFEYAELVIVSEDIICKDSVDELKSVNSDFLKRINELFTLFKR